MTILRTWMLIAFCLLLGGPALPARAERLLGSRALKEVDTTREDMRAFDERRLISRLAEELRRLNNGPGEENAQKARQAVEALRLEAVRMGHADAMPSMHPAGGGESGGAAVWVFLRRLKELKATMEKLRDRAEALAASARRIADADLALNEGSGGSARVLAEEAAELVRIMRLNQKNFSGAFLEGDVYAKELPEALFPCVNRIFRAAVSIRESAAGIEAKARRPARGGEGGGGIL